jgi:hypothetical protein
MRYFLEIARTGLTAVLLHPLQSAVTTACVVVLLLPFLVGLALSKGVEHEARDSIRFGADLYVSGDQFGRRVPIPVHAVTQIREIEGVQVVTTLSPLSAPQLLAADVGTIHLDLAAAEKNYGNWEPG